MSQDDASSEDTPGNAPLEEALAAVERGDHARVRELLKGSNSGDGILDDSSVTSEDLLRVEQALRNDSFGVGIAIVTGVTLLILAVLLF